MWVPVLPNAKCPLPSAELQTPNAHDAQCQMPNAPCPMPDAPPNRTLPLQALGEGTTGAAPAGRGRPVTRGKKMVRTWPALLAALMVCLPIGGELTPALGVDLGHVHWRGIPDKPPPPADLMVAYPCLLVLAFILLRVEHTRALHRRGHPPGPLECSGADTALARTSPTTQTKAASRPPHSISPLRAAGPAT